MADRKVILTRRARLISAKRRKNNYPLAGELLERRFAPAGLPITFTVPVEVANKGVYAAVFGNPTTSNTANFLATSGNAGSMTVGHSALFTSGQSSGSFIGEVTITDLVKSTIYKYKTNASNKLGELTYVSGDTNHTYAAGSVVSFAGPDIAQAPFVYLGSPTLAATTTASTTPTATVQPALGILGVVSTTGFASSGTITVAPPQQSGFAVTYTGKTATTFTGVTTPSGKGLGPNWTVTQTGVLNSTTVTAAIGPSAATKVPVTSVAGFPTSGTAIAFTGTQTVRFTYSGLDTTPGSQQFTGVWFLDNAAINYDPGTPANTATIVAANALGSPLTVGSTTGFAGSGQLLVQAPAGLATSPVQVSTNVAVSYAGTTGTTFTGVTAFPSGSLPSLPSGGNVYQLPGPDAATAYLPVPTSGNLPLVNLFPTAGSIPGSGTTTTTATLQLPDPKVTGILSGVIVLSVGTPIALPVSMKSVTNLGPATVATVGSPTPATNANDVFGIFEWGLTSKQIDFDVSEVDQVGFPFSVTTTGTAPPPPADPVNGVGMRQDRTTLFDGFKTFIQNAATGAVSYAPAKAFLQGAADVPNFPGVPVNTRLTAPQDIIGNLLQSPPLAVALPTGPAGPPAEAYYWVTAVSAEGESMPSLIVTGNTGTGSDIKQVAQSHLQISWQPYPYATGYNVYWSSGQDLSTAQRINSSPVTGTSFIDTSPASHSGGASGKSVPTSNYLYNSLNSYYTHALRDFFAYYAPTTATVGGIKGAGNTFVLDDQATMTKWTGTTQTGLLIGSNSGYTALQLTGSAGTWGSQFSGKTIWVVMPLFSSNTSDSSLNPLPPFPSNLPAASAGESGTTMVIAGDGVFGAYAAPAATLDAGDSADLYNNIVSAFNRGLTPVRNADGSWNAVLPPTYWANSPVLNSATAATTGGNMAAGDYRYWITSVDINGTSGNQTTFSNVVEATTTQGTSTSGTNSVALDWTAVNFQGVTSGKGAIYTKSFNIYRSQKQANGTWNAPAFLQNVTNGPTNPTTTWTDTNATPSGSPGQPLVNYYAPGTASNYYSAYFSDLAVSYNGLGYGYPYADKNGQSTNVQMNYPDGITSLAVTFNPWTPSSALTVTPSTADLVQGQQLVISGSGFSTTPVDNIVTLSSGSGSVTAVNGTGTRLTYTFTTNPALGALTAIVQVGSASSGAAVQVATVVAASTKPVVTAPATFTVKEDTTGNLLWPATPTPFTDADSPSLTVTLSVLDGSINATGRSGVLVGGTPTARTFQGTVTALNTFFKTAGWIAYTPAAHNTQSRTLTTVATDGKATSNPVTSTIRITPVDDAPTVTPVPASFTTAEDTAVALRFTAGPFADVDATPTTQFRATLTAVGGDTFTIYAGDPAVQVTGSGSGTVTFTGTLSSLNSYFTSQDTPTRISYLPAKDFSGTRALTLAFRDLGTSASASAPVSVVVTPVNDPPVVTAPSQFRVTLNQPGNLRWPPTPVPFTDVDAQRLTVTLAVTGGTGTLAANVPGGLVVTGQGTATMTIAGPIAALNQYVQTAGRLTYTATGPSVLPRTLTITASDGTATSLPAVSMILVAHPNPVGPPTINPSGTVPGGQRGQWLVITYDQLVVATGAAPSSRSLEFMLNSQTRGVLQVWNGSAWVAPPSFGRFPVPVPLMGPGGRIRWLPPATGSGAVPAFVVSLWDGKLKSGNTCQVSVQVSGT
ncbi:MAG: hypothetical protein WCH77_09285 [Planctomycetota bacterium]